MEKHNILTKRDLLKFESDLFNDLVPLLECEGASLYFPTSTETKKIVYLEEEKKLLLPLKFINSDNSLAIFLARNPQKEKLAKVLPSLEYIIHQVLEKLVFKKALQYDNRTELYTQYMLIDRLAEKVDKMRQDFSSAPDFSKSNFLTQGCAGVVYLHLAHLPSIAKRYGYLFAEKCLDDIVLHFLEQLPHDVILSRIDSYDCAFFIDEDILDNRAELNSFLNSLCLSASALSFIAPESIQGKTQNISTSVHASYILFPQDYDSFTTIQNTEELAYHLIAKAQTAAKRAKDQQKTFLPFSLLLSEGGNIIELLSHNQCIINLGRNAGLKDIMRFSVYEDDLTKNELFSDTQKIYKGEIHLVEISEEYSIAEQSFIYDPAYSFKKGDTLIRLPADYGLKTSSNHQDLSSAIEKDSHTQLYKYSDFHFFFSEFRQAHPSFVLALLSFEENKDNSIPFQNILSESVHFFYEHIAKPLGLDIGKDCLLSAYGQHSIILCTPLNEKFSKNDYFEAYTKFVYEVSEALQQNIALGIAEHPLLHYRVNDAVENARKANECAKLLEFPKISFCDSVALNVSADKFATQGLYYEAVQEYQASLLLDNKNTLAHSSLGLALANLSRDADAKNSFLSALELSPQEVSLYYNLGGICEKLGEKDEAIKYYTECLQSHEFAFFALLKLGQISQDQNNPSKAKEYYTKALEIHPNFSTPYRQLAFLALEENNPTLAREYLHTALHYAPHDQKSLLLLARIYLENNEDPSLAAVLLAPIMNRKQKDREIWKLYVKALQLQGKTEAAAKAEKTLRNL